MMKTLMLLCLISAPAWAQDEPRDPLRRPERPGRPGDAPREGRPQDGPRDGQPGQPGQGPREGRPGQPPNPPPPPGAERRAPAPMNLEEVRAWLKDNEPQVFHRLMQLQEEGRREDVLRILGEAAPRMREMAELQQRDPKTYERMLELRRMELESMALADQARRAPPEEREAASKKLQENLAKLFDLREENRARELVELKRRVEMLEKALADRKTSKERIVEKRRRELMGEKIDEDW
jgi:hypothetical protein